MLMAGPYRGATSSEGGLVPEKRLEIAAYIERCRLPDGGYFFARVLPSSLQDTYYAVQSLGLLDLMPARPDEVVAFLLEMHRTGAVTGLSSIYYFAETMLALGQPVPHPEEYVARILARRNDRGGFGSIRAVPVEIASELEATFHGAAVLIRLGYPLRKDEVCRFVLGFHRPEGGFGTVRASLASTYYAVRILHLIGCPDAIPANTRDYLLYRERIWDIYFLDRVYWLVGALHLLGARPQDPPRIKRFVGACRVPGQGFRRASTTAISTLEDTYYALRVLKLLAGA